MTDGAPKGGGPLGLDAATMLAAGGFVLVFGLIVVSLSFVTSPILAYICLPAGVIPGAIAVGFGAIEYRREKHLEEFAAYLKAYRRIRMDDLAKRIGKTPMQAERLLAKAIDLGYVRGVIDRSTDEFVLAVAEKEQMFIGKCPNCGGEVERWVFPEERFECPYCDAAVDASAATPATR